ncbi:MAG: carboxypeptidase-like regulatory domain-containing protein [Bacteroidales bacterium]|nr:carboxypeptidase-like regulatory domain-containing protein [Bacteroidales bacterium]MBN2819776.1 carboxypeptidase-like regulatory domain-containing protein [Bacteroidales bacterium]
MIRIKYLLLGIVFSVNLQAQDYHQTVKGKIIDKESHASIEFATVVLNNSDQTYGVISDSEGNYRFDRVPVGRYTLSVQFMGYESVNIQNIEVTSGKELIVNAELQESPLKLDEVTIKATSNKEKVQNSFAAISARTFSVEESQRYAGSSNDVSRMAMNYAGVNHSAETTNEIVIRGNSPFGLLFRLDGVDIPNPSHFGDGASTGGVISMLNNNLLTNSDFYTSAFPAEFANTISGVFDLRLRNGNNEKHEFMGQAGLLTYELCAEGPLNKSSKSSYLVDYRYSTLELLSYLGLSAMGNAIPKYQDFTFKLNFPNKKLGNFSVFGLGGKSNIEMMESERDTLKPRESLPYESDYEMDMQNKNYSGSFGITHSYVFNQKAYTRFILSATSIRNYNSWDSLSTTDRSPTLLYFGDFRRSKLAVRFFLNNKINSKNSFRAGVNFSKHNFYAVDSAYDGTIEQHRVLRDFNGDDFFLQPYFQYKYRVSEKLQATLGINGFAQLETKHFSPEPRAGLNWEIKPGSKLSFGYGKHSLSTPLEILHQKVWNFNGSYSEPNKGLDFTKSHHFVLGYDRVFSGLFRIKTELYYQYIYNAVVEQKSNAYSLLNRRAYDYEDVGALKNSGKGYNYGLELTMEKFMDHGSYFLTTLSLFESKYRGSDGILRNSAFNSNHVLNLLGGKEYNLKSRREASKYVKKLVLDGKVKWSGGMRYTPLDIEQSALQGTTIPDESRPFSEQLPDYFSLDFRIGLKLSGKNSSQEIALDIRNATNRQNPFDIRYDIETGDVKYLTFGMMPDLIYRINF